MKIWFQLMASEKRSPGFISAVQDQLNRCVGPSTEILVRGTTHGAFADQYRLLFHYDEREIILNGLQAQRSGFDVFALGNSLDPGVVALREVLDIPIVVQMEVSCAVACMTGDKFGVVATNRKTEPRYREIVDSYGWTSRLAGVDSVRFDHLPRIHEAFTDPEVAAAVIEAYKASARRLAARGADTVIGGGVHTTIAAQEGLREVDGVIVQDTYALLAKFAETAAAIHQYTGAWTSRGPRYAKPPAEVLAKAAEMYDIPLLDGYRRRRDVRPGPIPWSGTWQSDATATRENTRRARERDQRTPQTDRRRGGRQHGRAVRLLHLRLGGAHHRRPLLPGDQPGPALLSTFAVYAVSFVARPFGGFLFGYIGDKYGRLSVLTWTVVLMGEARCSSASCRASRRSVSCSDPARRVPAAAGTVAGRRDHRR